MPPKACPLHLQRLIDRFNEQPSESNPIKQILKAFGDIRHGKSADTVTVKGLSQITINLVNFRVTLRDELELALLEIDLSKLADLVRECPVEFCGRLFWVSTKRKVACDDHIDLLRKRRNRRDQKNRRVETKVRGRKAELEGTLRSMTPTAIAVIRAVGLHGARYFYEIDWWVDNDFREAGERSPTTLAVRQTTKPLVRNRYLECSPNAKSPKEDYYTGTQKLFKLWNEMREFGLEKIPTR